MNKIKILSISKSSKYNEFSFEKKQEFLTGFRNFLIDMAFDKNDSRISGFGRPFKGPVPIDDKERGIKEFVDVHYRFNPVDYDELSSKSFMRSP